MSDEEIGDTNEKVSWQLLAAAAIEAVGEAGYSAKRRPGRGLSNSWDLTKDGKTQVVSIRTTRNRWFAFHPRNSGKEWKTLDDADMVMVAACDDYNNPQYIDVYLMPANDVRERFISAYKARVDNGNVVRDDFGMWIKLDPGSPDVVSEVGSGLSQQYPAIARYKIEDFRNQISPDTEKEVAEATPEPVEPFQVGGPTFTTVSDVLAWARTEIARVSGMPSDMIKLEIRMQA